MHKDNWMSRHALCVVLIISILSGCVPAMPIHDETPDTANVDVDPWPRQITSRDDTFSIFELQYEHWEQDRLSAQAAVEVENQVSPQPQYGVITFTARTEVDKESRRVTLEDVTITKADFPTAPDGGAVYLAPLREALSGPVTVALDRFHAARCATEENPRPCGAGPERRGADHRQQEAGVAGSD